MKKIYAHYLGNIKYNIIRQNLISVVKNEVKSIFIFFGVNSLCFTLFCEKVLKMKYYSCDDNKNTMFLLTSENIILVEIFNQYLNLIRYLQGQITLIKYNKAFDYFTMFMSIGGNKNSFNAEKYFYFYFLVCFYLFLSQILQLKDN